MAYICLDNRAYWDYHDEKLYFSQKEMKVGEEKNSNFVFDAEWINIGSSLYIF